MDGIIKTYLVVIFLTLLRNPYTSQLSILDVDE
jgi:hypothetical protein